MRFAEIECLLDPRPLALEMGYERLDDGVLHVAIRTDMPGCTGAMLDWWFGARIGTREYRWWHPIDHISSAWRGGSAGSAIGATHLVEERFTDMPAETLSIEFRDPREVFDPAALDAAIATGAVSAILLAHGGAGHEPARTADGAVIGTRLVHVCRDTRWGLVLRSHFFLGHDLPGLGVPPAALAGIFPDALAPALLQHCYDEFRCLADILPGIHRAESGLPAVRPW